MDRAPRFLKTNSLRNALAVICGTVLMAGTTLAETVIYEDGFDGPADAPLAGSAPGVRSGSAGGTAEAVWASGGHWHADGTVASGPTGGDASSLNQFTDNGLLPFKPQAGHVYTLSVTLTRAIDSPNNWLWAGFAGEDLEAGGTRGRPNSGQRGLGWVIAPISDGFQTFTGPGTEGGKARSKPAIASGEPFNLRIVLDTKTDPQDWRLEWFVQDRSVRGPERLGGTTVGGREIRQVGFGRFINAGGAVSRFSLVAE